MAIQKIELEKKKSSGVDTLYPKTSADMVVYDDNGTETTVQDKLDTVLDGGVTGVKGDKEASYRTGDVNLTAANIGAEPAGSVAAHDASAASHSDIRNSVGAAQSKADSAYVLAEGRSRAITYETITAMVQGDTGQTPLAQLSSMGELKTGDHIYIRDLEVPDFWVYDDNVDGGYQDYVFNTEEMLIEDVKLSALKFGNCSISLLETAKVDLTPYQPKNDNNLTTDSKLVVPAINEVNANANAAVTKSDANETEITKIKNGTTTVPSATEAAQAVKLKTARTITVSLNSGVGTNGTGNTTFDGTANKSITVALADSGVNAGTYSALTVNAKGIVTAGGQMIEFGAAGQSEPSPTLAVGGLFFKDAT